MKVLYHIGEEITRETVMEEGILKEENESIYIQNWKEKILLNEIISVETQLINGLGHMIKVGINYKSIFIAVPWVYIKIGTGFAIINSLKTIELLKKLQQKL